jgi:hemerythrin
MLTWRDEYYINIELIDNQHKELLEIGNEALTAIQSYSNKNKQQEIISLMNKLTDYTIFHFKEEEEYMLEINYPAYLAHKEEHDNFINNLNELKAQNGTNPQLTNLQALCRFIINWIINHILKTDMQLKK